MRAALAIVLISLALAGCAGTGGGRPDTTHQDTDLHRELGT